MSNVPLTLGSIAFRDFEVPEQIIFGGGQALAIHQVIGGNRIVETLGAADGEILLAGVFSGPDATTRAQALDSARSLGDALPLVWKGFFYSVVIAELAAAYTKAWWIPFRLRLVVVRDLVTAVPNSLEQAALDLTAAQIYAEQGGIPFAGIVVGNPGSIAAGLASASSALSLNGASFAENVGTLNGSVDTAAGVTAVDSMTSSASALAGLANTQAYLRRAAMNLAGASG